VGQTSALVDARGNRHSFTYDSTGAQTQLIDPLNRRTTSAYDAAGQQNLRIDARKDCRWLARKDRGQSSGLIVAGFRKNQHNLRNPHRRFGVCVTHATV
jgi:uncharacterized protein RhaS with RHS repeats